MRTNEWMNTRIPRATARIRREVAQRNLRLGMLLDAMREITDDYDSPSEDDVRLLSQALGCLSIDEYRVLLSNVSDSLRLEAEEGVDYVLSVLDKEEADDSATAPKDIALIRAREAKDMGNLSYRFSLLMVECLMQALLWAVIPVPEREPRISY